MRCIAGKREELPQCLMEEVGRYRHRVFVGRLGWRLRSSGDVESDEFDGPDAVYVFSRDEHNEVNAVARLLPTTVPYLLEGVFPTLWGNARLPHEAGVWELSRFATVDFAPSLPQVHQASTRSASKFFRHVVEVAKERGARTLITVSPLGMERLLRLNGFSAVRAGFPTIHEGAPVVALKIALN